MLFRVPGILNFDEVVKLVSMSQDAPRQTLELRNARLLAHEAPLTHGWGTQGRVLVYDIDEEIAVICNTLKPTTDHLTRTHTVTEALIRANATILTATEQYVTVSGSIIHRRGQYRWGDAEDDDAPIKLSSYRHEDWVHVRRVLSGTPLECSHTMVLNHVTLVASRGGWPV